MGKRDGCRSIPRTGRPVATSYGSAKLARTVGPLGGAILVLAAIVDSVVGIPFTGTLGLQHLQRRGIDLYDLVPPLGVPDLQLLAGIVDFQSLDGPAFRRRHGKDGALWLPIGDSRRALQIIRFGLLCDEGRQQQHRCPGEACCRLGGSHSLFHADNLCHPADRKLTEPTYLLQLAVR